MQHSTDHRRDDPDDTGAVCYDRRTYDRRTISEFRECPRYDRHELAEEQIVDLAKRAVALARTEFYADVGRNVTSKLFAAMGMIIVGAFAWLVAKGYIK
jgi:hypothetical protein